MLVLCEREILLAVCSEDEATSGFVYMTEINAKSHPEKKVHMPSPTELDYIVIVRMQRHVMIDNHICKYYSFQSVLHQPAYFAVSLLELDLVRCT